MKKIVFSLIAVLLLGTFVACDGETDFLLWDEEPVASKFLKLKIIDDVIGADFSFVGGTEKVVEIKLPVDDSVKTWQDLIDQSFEIPLYEYHEDAYFKRDVFWYEYGDYFVLLFTDSDYHVFVTYDTGIDFVPKTAEIDFDSQYLLIFNIG